MLCLRLAASRACPSARVLLSRVAFFPPRAVPPARPLISSCLALLADRLVPRVVRPLRLLSPVIHCHAFRPLRLYDTTYAPRNYPQTVLFRLKSCPQPTTPSCPDTVLSHLLFGAAPYHSTLLCTCCLIARTFSPSYLSSSYDQQR